jgi:hypothetical protein
MLTVPSFVLPAASFYSLNKAVGPLPAMVFFMLGFVLPKRWMVFFLQGFFASRSLMRELLEPYFSRIHFTKDQKNRWFRDRETVLFGKLCNIPQFRTLSNLTRIRTWFLPAPQDPLGWCLGLRYCRSFNCLLDYQDHRPSPSSFRECRIRRDPDRMEEQARVFEVEIGRH